MIHGKATHLTSPYAWSSVVVEFTIHVGVQALFKLHLTSECCQGTERCRLSAAKPGGIEALTSDSGFPKIRPNQAIGKEKKVAATIQ